MTKQDVREPRSKGRNGVAVVAGVLAVLVLVGVGGAAGFKWWQERTGGFALAGERLREFPEIDRTGLSETQGRILTVAEREFEAQNPGTKYSEGIDEAWCADFVSWVMRESGRPLANPNSGSWRIPGVYTLEEYYRGESRFEDLGYQPRIGDVVMYTAASVFNQHTNIVIDVAGDTITTLGGNEFDEITIHRYRPADVSGLVGFGRL
ncbi:CHAP domain-containing protein [Nocardia sp. NPDC057668]|uniref:CHAP domain-containing protein n=1 Tax=Nocardia sp. NPDC057668 TaxID=3346202 RepID=UPI00366B3018